MNKYGTLEKIGLVVLTALLLVPIAYFTGRATIPNSAETLALVALIVSALSVPVSYFTSKHFGDVAADKAMVKRQEELAKRAHDTSIRLLLRELARIKAVLDHNSIRNEITPPIKLPTVLFETAFCSNESILINEVTSDSDLLDSAMIYLTAAQGINSLIDVQLSLMTSPAYMDNAFGADRYGLVKETGNRCRNAVLHDTINGLSANLQSKLET